MADDQLVAVAAANELKSFTDVYIAALGIGTNGMISPFQLNQIASPKLVFTKSILDVKTTSNNINQEFVNTIKGVVCECMCFIICPKRFFIFFTSDYFFLLSFYYRRTTSTPLKKEKITKSVM
ncbi:hypothetical protein DPMN_024338 [Dreissena polymorpha]|uniref:Uncharacterized protein n=1 Tax=Dreissena polymorpha TaxID=45954 RepID=A0A9D4LMA1_DREPO|nr:hypothetical protein DPMN_024338 [Dreissena polymorpha]